MASSAEKFVLTFCAKYLVIPFFMTTVIWTKAKELNRDILNDQGILDWFKAVCVAESFNIISAIYAVLTFSYMMHNPNENFQDWQVLSPGLVALGTHLFSGAIGLFTLRRLVISGSKSRRQ